MGQTLCIYLFLIFIVFKGSFTITTCNSNGRGGGCELYCHQVTNTSVSCSCGVLGTLQSNNRTCYIKHRLIFPHGLDFLLAEEAENGIIPIVQWKATFPSPFTKFIAQDYGHDRIFYVYTDTQTRYDVLGYINVRDRKLYRIATYKEPLGGLAYDSFNEDVYISQNGEILVIKYYDSPIIIRHQLFTKFDSPGKLQIDPVSRLMFVIKDSQNIVRVDLTDASNVVLFNHTSESIASLTLDTVNEKIFWIVDKSAMDTIEIMNYDGSCHKVLQKVNSNTPHSITYWNGSLFWSDNNKKIYKTQVEGGDTEFSGINIQYNVMALEFYGKINYTGMWSAWSESPTEKGFLRRSCLRPDIQHFEYEGCLSKYNVDKFVCEGDRSKKIKEMVKDDDKISITLIIGACIGAVVFFILLIMIVKVCYDKKRKSANTHPPTLHYENSIQRDFDFGMYQTGLGHIYESIPELQQQLKEKALKEGGIQPNDNATSNEYLDPAELRVNIPEKQSVYKVTDEPAEDPYHIGFDTAASTEQVTGAGAVNASARPPPSSNDYKNMIESNRLSI